MFNKMVLAKSKNAVGLGNSLMNDRFGKEKGADRKKVSAGIHRTGPGGETVSYYLSYNMTCSVLMRIHSTLRTPLKKHHG